MEWEGAGGSPDPEARRPAFHYMDFRLVVWPGNRAAMKNGIADCFLVKQSAFFSAG